MLEESYAYMKERNPLKKLSTLALRKRRQGLARLLPPVGETLRGSLIERYLTCGHLGCRCARGKRHGPVWYLTVTLAPGRTTGGVVAASQVAAVRRWIQLPPAQAAVGKNLRHQPRTAAPGAPEDLALARQSEETF